MSSRFLGIVKFLQDCAATFEDGRGSTFSARPHPEGTRTLRIRTAKDVSIPVSSSGTAAKLTTEDWSAKTSSSSDCRYRGLWHWPVSESGRLRHGDGPKNRCSPPEATGLTETRSNSQIPTLFPH